MAPRFRYRDGVEITEGAAADGSDGVAFTRNPIGPSEDYYTHVDYAGRKDESPAEKTLRDNMNDYGRALESHQRETGPGPANPTPVVNHYPLDQDGDEDK